MQVAEAIAAILKQEGVKFIVGYPVNPIICLLYTSDAADE